MRGYLRVELEKRGYHGRVSDFWGMSSTWCSKEKLTKYSLVGHIAEDTVAGYSNILKETDIC